MNVKHTPGPWGIDNTGGSIPYIVEAEGQKRTLATIETLEDGVDNGARREEREANARLIEAAPNLYKVVRTLLDQASYDEEFWKQARAAIAKVEGT